MRFLAAQVPTLTRADPTLLGIRRESDEGLRVQIEWNGCRVEFDPPGSFIFGNLNVTDRVHEHSCAL